MIPFPHPAKTKQPWGEMSILVTSKEPQFSTVNSLCSLLSLRAGKGSNSPLLSFERGALKLSGTAGKGESSTTLVLLEGTGVDTSPDWESLLLILIELGLFEKYKIQGYKNNKLITFIAIS
jgi:hypothetical protein